MFRVAILRFYYKPMNNALPPYFDVMQPVLPRIVNLYEITKPSFLLTNIRHEFAEHLIEYCLINCLNKEEDSISITRKVCTFFSEFHTLSQDKCY